MWLPFPYCRIVWLFALMFHSCCCWLWASWDKLYEKAKIGCDLCSGARYYDKCFTNSWYFGKDCDFCVAVPVSVELGRIKQQKEETCNDSQRASEKTRNCQKNEETIQEHDQKIAMNRNIFKQRLLLEGWLVLDRMPFRYIVHGRSLKESLFFFKSRVSEPVSFKTQYGSVMQKPGNYQYFGVKFPPWIKFCPPPPSPPQTIMNT